ncbi:HAAS signaling domain-containing protein [Streptococcus cameli]
MTRNEYLQELSLYLTALPQEERENVLDYFAEYFADCNDDAAAIKQLGTPAEAAKAILDSTSEADNHEKQSTEQGESDLRSDSSKSFKETFKQLFNAHFQDEIFKHTSFKTSFSFNQDLIEKEPIVLENVSKLTVTASEQNIHIRQVKDTTPSIIYKVNQDDTETTLDYSLIDGRLVLDDLDEQIEEITLFIPTEYSLDEISIEVEDSNVSLKGIEAQTVQILGTDVNLDLNHCQFQHANLELEDCNLNSLSTRFADTRISLQDCNVHTTQCSFIGLVEVEAEDCNLSFYTLDSQKLSMDIQLEDGYLIASDAFKPFIQEIDDETTLQTENPNASGRLKIRAQDAMVTIKENSL